MKILIVENEIYLAGSVASKLSSLGHECEIAKSAKEAMRDENFDVVLLSTTLPGQDFYPVIERHKSSIIILLIAYISNDTVSKPIAAGADDYVQKPFMFEELVRKIDHFAEHGRLKKLLQSYEKYADWTLRNFNVEAFDPKKIKLPLLIRTPKILYADKFVRLFMKTARIPFELALDANFSKIEKILANSTSERYVYVPNFQFLKADERDKILTLSAKKKLIIATTDMSQIAPFETLDIPGEQGAFSVDEIITIDEYIKCVIANYQERFPDTELSKKLGISRKSLWEKRKKYDIVKKK